MTRRSEAQPRASSGVQVDRPPGLEPWCGMLLFYVNVMGSIVLGSSSW